MTVPPPCLAANAPAEAYEASTATPYLGTALAGNYAPNATDAIDGDLSANVTTFLAATNEPIDLATYVFPLGATAIKNVVTNSFGLTAEQTVTIVVRDTAAPTVAVTGASDIAVAAGSGPINYSGKVGAAMPESGEALPLPAGVAARGAPGAVHRRGGLCCRESKLYSQTPKRKPLPIPPKTVHGHRPGNARPCHLRPALWRGCWHGALPGPLGHHGGPGL